MPMKSSEIRKPHSPNWKDMNATKAPIAIPTTVMLIAEPPFRPRRFWAWRRGHIDIVDLDVDLDDLQPDEFLNSPVNSSADLVGDAVQGMPIDGHKVDIHRHLGLAHFGANTRGMVRTANSVTDCAKRAGWT
jgi:hypothetical protein